MRMKHPVHGFHVPMPGERESMLKNGWVDEVAELTPRPGDVATVEGIVQSSGEPVVFVAPIKRGPGRPRKAA